MTKLRTKTNKNILVADTLVVDRSRWVMGSFVGVMGRPRMLNNQGNMCCLGFMCAAAGFGEEDLKNEYYPEDVLRRCNKREDRFWDIPYLTVVTGDNSKFATQAASINDNSTNTLKERETRLKAHFKKAGIKLTFKGKYPEAILKEEKLRHGGQS